MPKNDYDDLDKMSSGDTGSELQGPNAKLGWKRFLISFAERMINYRIRLL